MQTINMKSDRNELGFLLLAPITVQLYILKCSVKFEPSKIPPGNFVSFDELTRTALYDPVKRCGLSFD